MFNSQSYHKWRKTLMQLIPDNCPSRLTNLALLIVGIFAAQSVYLSVEARKLPIAAKKLSLEKRLERFLGSVSNSVELQIRRLGLRTRATVANKVLRE